MKTNRDITLIFALLIVMALALAFASSLAVTHSAEPTPHVIIISPCNPSATPTLRADLPDFEREVRRTLRRKVI